MMRSRALRLLSWTALTIFLYLVIRDYYFGAILMHNPASLASKRQLIFWVWLGFAVLAWAGALGFAWSGKLPSRWVETLARLHRRIPRLVRMVLAALLLIFPTYLFLYTPVGNYNLHYWARLGTLFLVAFLAALMLYSRSASGSELVLWAGMVLVSGSIFAAFTWLNKVTDFPFSLTWSEGNRLWDYSMLFGSDRYQIIGEKGSFTFISAGRQFLWGLPFVFPSLTIYGARLWDALLWIVPAALIGWAGVVRQPAAPNGWVWKVDLGLWTFLFLAQGPIYAPLLVSALLVVLALRLRSLPLAAAVVMISAYYAAISRSTWAYAPGLWAGMLALLEVQFPGLRPRQWKALVRPVTLGIAGYVGGQFLPVIVRLLTDTQQAGKTIKLVMDPVAQVSRQPLLWERLLPNPTFAPGILLGTLWAALPLIVLLVVLLVRRIWRPNKFQLAAVTVICGAFLAVGIIASTKIGGGSNLHNLDMFWVSLALLVTWIVKDLLRRNPVSLRGDWLLQLALAAALIGPASYMVRYGAPLGGPSREIVDTSVESLRQNIGEAAQQGTVLFLDQRQLLTFHTIQNVPLVTDYEKKYLMEQAMSANVRYFEGFTKDLSEHRFRMIVTEPIRLGLVSEDTRNFAQENNAWVTYVSTPLLEYYEPLINYDEVGIQLLVPKE